MNPPRLFSRTRRHLGAATIIFAIGILVADAAGPRLRQVSARNVTRGYAVEPLAANELRQEDRAFINKAVETTRQQMRLAEIGLSHAVSSDVRSHAQQLATDYRSINQSLEALARRKGGMAGAPVGGTSETYGKLVTAPATEFDRAFIRTVGQLTSDLLSLCEQIVSESRDQDLREFAAAQLPVLRGHRSEVTQLQETYY